MPATNARLPATFETTETFSGKVKKAALDREVTLRLKAGAIRCSYVKKGTGWLMTTEWNVIGGNG